jgi:dihydrofolate reductase
VAKLLYTVNTSLDGYIEDTEGDFSWGVPDDEIHLFFNDLIRSLGTLLYGRRMYETMAVWETDPSLAEGSEIARDFAEVWQAADKIVYSTTLRDVTTERTRIVRSFDAGEIERLKQDADADIGIGGPGLAAHAFRAGLVDEYLPVLHPVAVGDGKSALPSDLFLKLELLDTRRFASGVTHLRYAIGS